MRTSFSRQFGLTAGMILLSFVLLGCSFTSLFYNYMLREEKTSLSTNASAVAAYVGAQSVMPAENDWELQLSVSYGASVSDTDVVLADENGVLVMCSCADFRCGHVGKQLDDSFFSKLQSEGYVYATGVLLGVYEDERYLYGIPIRAADSQELLGYVVVSRATRDMSEMMSRIVGLFLFTAVLVLLVAMIATMVITRRQTETLGRTLLTFEQKIEEKQLDVQVNMPEKAVYVMANEDAITQVIYNLIDNGVKFAENGTPFLLTVAVSGGKALISVANTGPEIPSEELPLVFDRFHKSDKSRSEHKDGVGLGLYIVKTILGSHGEDITVTSRNGRTTFTFTLALSR